MNSRSEGAGDLGVADKNFYQRNMADVKIHCEKTRAEKMKTKKDKSDCLNLRKTLLGSSPRLVILKSAEDLCIKGFDIGVKKHKTVEKVATDPKVNERLLTTIDQSQGDSSSAGSGTGPRVVPTRHKSSSYCCLYFGLVSSILLTTLSILSFIWTPYSTLMNERLKMVRGLPAYEWWANPPDEVLLRVYLFNITNAQQFLDDPEAKLHMQEVGPYIFREKLVHKDVKFNENGTMTYTAHRTAIFLPEMNHLSLNATLVLPNLAVLGMSSYLWDASFFTKLGFNLLQNRLDSQPLMNTTVYNYFWNLSDPLLKVAHQLAPTMVPVQNMGILHQIYSNFVDEVTVYMGPDNGYRFFKVNQFHGSPRFGYWDNETCDSVQGATEGVTYHQSISKTDTLKYLRKTICRVVPLDFTHEEIKMGMTVYKFELPLDIYSRPPDGSEECFLRPGLPSLPSGLTDVSPCYYNFPIAASFPHFLNAEKSVKESIVGLASDKAKHGSFVIVEPNTGVPMESRARSQSNLVVRQVSSFPRVKRFSNTFIPMFWAEYNQVGLPWYIASLMYFTVNILPVTQTYFSCLFTVLGAILIVRVLFSIIQRKRESSRPLYSYSSLDLIPPPPKC
ncbi:scavenger receptor class B member 1-like [Macrosteles quadrilineatus]|uniref:scavenger receptor class B member 1-like n=1 Tax=Macrosteles quadrilineatus TaxID=74068 RepID=UPI0023E0B284|nr:scavenger receptor class B member 1-like [Macrosteles quadrilineatus]XP_054281068.1 scavenger receptor class B member 1-like [Macrosteles quadrilineatus]